MKKFFIFAIFLLMSTFALADSIELKTGEILVGDFAGFQPDKIEFKVLMSYSPDDVLSVNDNGKALLINDEIAKTVLSVLSSAAETYADMNAGKYPEKIEMLLEGEAFLLNENYCDREYQGYIYECEMAWTGYTFKASPVKMGFSGLKIYKITTGGFWE